MAEREVHGDRRMSDLEALMWNLEKDPHLNSTFANVTILDRPPDLERFRRKMARAVTTIPRLRQRVVPGFGRLAPPMWQDDPSFDIDFHVRRDGLPDGATDRDLFDFATRYWQIPFDRTRPLWAFALVDGLPGGRGAIVQKMHHTITDGVGGVRMSEQFIDLERDPSPPMGDVEPEATLADAGPSGFLATLSDTAAHVARRTAGAAQRGVQETAHVLAHPTQWGAVGSAGVETTRSVVRQTMVTDHAHSPLWTERSLWRRLEVLSVPMEDARRVAKDLDGSLNDFFVTGAARGAGAYHQAKGAPVDELRMAMPISTRSDHSSGGNSFAPSRVLVPTAIDDPVTQFTEVRDRLARTRTERAFSVLEGLAGVMNVLPTSVLVRMTRQQVETVDFTTSNVRGAPLPLYIAGGLIEANYPLGPLAGTAFNLTLLSYDGALNMGLAIDTGAVDDPELLRTSIEQAFADLLAAG
jgi:WS/DGAT/MGAT family acyltransferase